MSTGELDFAFFALGLFCGAGFMGTAVLFLALRRLEKEAKP